jgi:hypothetical protein
MVDTTLDYAVETPAPPAAIAQQIEKGWIDTAMQCGAKTAYVKKIGAKWRFVAEFAEEDLAGYGHFAKLIEKVVPGAPMQVNVKKAGKA